MIDTIVVDMNATDMIMECREIEMTMTDMTGTDMIEIGGTMVEGLGIGMAAVGISIGPAIEVDSGIQIATIGRGLNLIPRLSKHPRKDLAGVFWAMWTGSLYRVRGIL